VPPGRFRHLIDAATYSDDVVVKVGTDRSEAWVSEQLLDRLLNLGRAYRLHVLTLLADMPRHEATWINRQQAEALIEEVEFVASLVDDSAVSELVATLLPLVAEAARHGDGNALVIEGP
jgi:hypothetical protein